MTFRVQRFTRGAIIVVAVTAAGLLGQNAPSVSGGATPAGHIDSVPAARIVISIRDRKLWVLADSADTLLTTDVAVGSGRTLSTGERSWTFYTKRGPTTVSRKDAKPLWVPPDWHYYEVARMNHLRVRQLSYDHPFVLGRGRSIVVRGNIVGVLSGAAFTPFEPSEEIVRGGTLFIPPFGTRNRMIPGVLGEYRLALANGVSLHGTNEQSSIGKAVTHGCVRLRDDDIRWLYDHIVVGTPVLIY